MFTLQNWLGRMNSQDLREYAQYFVPEYDTDSVDSESLVQVLLLARYDLDCREELKTSPMLAIIDGKPKNVSLAVECASLMIPPKNLQQFYPLVTLILKYIDEPEFASIWDKTCSGQYEGIYKGAAFADSNSLESPCSQISKQVAQKKLWRENTTCINEDTFASMEPIADIDTDHWIADNLKRWPIRTVDDIKPSGYCFETGEWASYSKGGQGKINPFNRQRLTAPFNKAFEQAQKYYGQRGEAEFFDKYLSPRQKFLFQFVSNPLVAICKSTFEKEMELLEYVWEACDWDYLIAIANAVNESSVAQECSKYVFGRDTSRLNNRQFITYFANNFNLIRQSQDITVASALPVYEMNFVELRRKFISRIVKLEHHAGLEATYKFLYELKTLVDNFFQQ